jgi:hypothetical protein
MRRSELLGLLVILASIVSGGCTAHERTVAIRDQSAAGPAGTAVVDHTRFAALLVREAEPHGASGESR